MKTKIFNGKLVFGLILIGILLAGSVSATHTATVTVAPLYVGGGGAGDI